MSGYKIGDAVLLSNGRKAIITKRGIYEGQFWCEVADASGINLCSADYFSVRGAPPVISKLLPTEDAAILAGQLKAAALENDEKYHINSAKDRYGPISHIRGQSSEIRR